MDNIVPADGMEDMCRSIFENMAEGVALHEVIYNEKGRAVNYRIVDVNPAYEKHTGISAAIAKGKLATELYGTEAAPYLPLWARVAETGKPHFMEVRFEPLKKSFSVTCCSPKKGWFATVFTDITAKKQTEEQLIQSEEKFRSLVETTGDWIWEVNEKGICTYSSPRSKTLLGYESGELVGKCTLDFIPPEDKKEFERMHSGIFKRLEPFTNLQYRCRHKSGKVVTLESSGMPIFDLKGNFKGYRGIDRDITERRLAEQALNENRVHLQCILESTTDGILAVDSTGKVIHSNRHFAEMWRIPQKLIDASDDNALLAHVLDQLVDPEAFLRKVKQLYGSDALDMDVLLFKDGRVFERYSAPLMQGGSVAGRVWSFRDVTRQREAEKAVQQLNRELEQRVKDRTIQLELANRELQAFSYSVSHDLRAPLRSIDGFSTAILEDCSDKLDAEGRDYLQRLRRASQRMATLIDDLLKLSRVSSSEINIASVNLSLMAANIISDLRKTGNRREIETVIASGVTVEADPQLMFTVMENLIGNAWKFTSKTKKAKIEFGVKKQKGETVYYIRDNGAGFDMAFVHKLFGSFQRLHSVEDFPGDGIGLASVQRVIHRHDGRAWAEGKPDKGAVFYFTLGTGAKEVLS